MKKYKMLSLLLALVLVVSAAGTAFAASGTDTKPAGSFGTLTCTIVENDPVLNWSIDVTATVKNALPNGILSVGATFTNYSVPNYHSSEKGAKSFTYRFVIPVPVDEVPDTAYGVAEAYAPGAEPYKADAQIQLSR